MGSVGESRGILCFKSQVSCQLSNQQFLFLGTQAMKASKFKWLAVRKGILRFVSVFRQYLELFLSRLLTWLIFSVNFPRLELITSVSAIPVRWTIRSSCFSTDRQNLK